jgi:DMSO reductase anchor subunit
MKILWQFSLTKWICGAIIFDIITQGEKDMLGMATIFGIISIFAIIAIIIADVIIINCNSDGAICRA